MVARKRRVIHPGRPAPVSRRVEQAAGTAAIKARGQVIGFFDFIRSQGVMGLATGIIIGTVVTALVRSFVDDVVNPLVGLFLVSDNLSAATFHLKDAEIRWGSFVSTLIDFLIIAAIVYLIFKILKLDKIDKKKDGA